MIKLYAGFDPGTNGSVVVVDTSGEIVGMATLSRESSDVAAALLTALGGVGWLAVEEVPFIPGQMNGQRLLCEHVGVAVGVAVSRDIAVQKVPAVTWQKWLGVKRDGRSYVAITKEDKARESRGRYKARKERIKQAVLALASPASRDVLGESDTYLDAYALALYARGNEG